MKVFLAVIAASFIGCCVGQSLVMEIEEGKTLYEMGESVTFKCTVREETLLETGWILNWEKFHSVTEKTSLGKNKIIEPAVDAATPGHFLLAAVKEDIEGVKLPVFRLTVKDLKNEDTGKYQCRIANLNDEREINVKKTPESMSMKVDQGHGYKPITESQEFTLQRGTKLTIQCKSTGGNPASTIAIKADGKLVESTSNEDIMRTAGDPNYQELVTYDITETATVTVEAHNDGTVYSCANIDNEGGVLFTNQFSVTLEGSAPIIECRSENITTYVGATKVTIMCTVEATPAVTEFDVEFFWYPRHVNETEQNKEVVKPNEKNGHYNGFMVISEDGIEISLVIDRIYPQAFRDYYITVKNSKGSSQAVVRLDRDESKEEERRIEAGASSLSSCMLVLALALLHLLNH